MGVTAPPATGVDRPASPTPRPHRWRDRIFKALIAFVALCVLASGGVYVYVRHQLGRIKKVDIPTLSDDQPGQVMNVLLVGSDSRANTTGDLADAAGKATEGDRAGLSDTMMILHIDPQQEQAAILSIPRDLWVDVNGSKDRINGAFADGGPKLLIKTIQDDLGIQINHYAEVDFAGFQNIIDTVGGLKIYIDAPARDEKSGLDLPTAGCVSLDGFQALAYVRSRYYESYEAGHWVSDPTSDFGRIKRQQDFIRRMLKKALSSGLSNPLTLNRLIGIGVDNLTIDNTMSSKDMVNLARRFRSLDPDTVDMQTLPATPYTTAGGADVLTLNVAEAKPLIDKINGKPAPEPVDVRPADVQVRVLNGNGRAGSASKAALALQGAGFQVTGSGDADGFGYATTVVRYGPTSLDKAKFLQSYLVAGATLEPDSTLGTADVAVVVGSDYAGVSTPPAASKGGPTTTSPGPATDAGAKGSTQPAC
jgi:LCP family protein required for cell wall assembly